MHDEHFRLCQQLKPIIGQKAETLWKYYELSDSPQARMQSAQMIKMVASAYLGSNLEQTDIRLPPLPPKHLDGPITLGEARFLNADRGSVGIGLNELTRHFGVFGTTGSGKTTLVWSLLRQIHRAGIPFLAIDWKRSYRNLRRLDDFKNLKIFTIGRTASPLFWNPLQPPPGCDFPTWVSILAEIFERSHVGGQGVAEIFIDAAIKERETAKDGLEGDFYPTLTTIRDRILRSRETGRKALWRDSCLRILRTFSFGPLADSLNSNRSSSLEAVLNTSAVIELDLALPANTRTFIAEALMRWIHLYRLNQGESGNLRHLIVLEEAHNILSQRSDSGVENLYRELRSFGQGLIAITQHPSMLPIYVLGNTHTIAFMQLTHEADIIAARQSLFLERGQDRYLDLLKTGEGILKIKGRIPATHVRFPMISIQGGNVADKELEDT